MSCCLCKQTFTATSNKKKLLLHGKACVSIKGLLEGFCIAEQGTSLKNYGELTRDTASLCHLCQTELNHHQSLKQSLQTCTNNIIQKLTKLEEVIQRKRAHGDDGESSPKRSLAEGEPSRTPLAHSPQEQRQRGARKRLLRSPQPTQSAQGSPPVQVKTYCMSCTHTFRMHTSVSYFSLSLCIYVGVVWLCHPTTGL